MAYQKEILCILVDNHPGVLARVSSLFSRRGYNIDSLTVSATDNPLLSRITIVVTGDEAILEQIISQTFKLEETREIFALDADNSLFRELLLVKVSADDETRGKVREIAEIYNAHIVDLSVASMVIELTGTPAKIDAFLAVVGEFKVLEMCRTGVTALERGSERHIMKK